MSEHTLTPGTSAVGTRRRTENPLDRLDDDAEVIVVSNRQPYRHEWDGDEVTVSQPTGGLTEGLGAAIGEIDGSWIAWGDGDADAQAVDEDDCVVVPPDADEDEQYTLERVWLGEAEVEQYYYGFSNRVLWPVCHSALTNVGSEARYWETYTDVNERFADAVAARASPGDVVWLQDYHFGRAPELIRARVGDDVSIAQFWHVPWPAWDTFRACPHAEELLRGLLGNDLLGVHVPRYCQNFLQCVDAAIPEATIDWGAGRVFHRDGETTVAAFPLGVDVDRIGRLASVGPEGDASEPFRADHGIDDDTTVAIGVDRLDYTKGIPERLEALERFWETSPEWRGDLTFVQVGTESRGRIDAYDELQGEIAAAVDRINARFGTDDWQPIVYTTARVPNETLYALYRYADVGVVSPLRDGMNLVAQEYVAAQPVDDAGVLVLSDQAGAHDVLGEAAVTVSPQDTAGFASQLGTALSMPADERRDRMRRLTHEVRDCDVSAWIDDVLDRVTRLRDGSEVTGRV